MSSTPWIEAYRPKDFNSIVLDPVNKIILSNIIETGILPNLLFFGPPGTGKTTTIVNLINAYQKKNNQQNKELMIHLNASDERGIDVIRIQINQFVNSKHMFNRGVKFVILDEVDYMTKNAQEALRYILQSQPGDVCFCLICNYISRIDEGLQNEMVKMRFNQLPPDDIITFLGGMCASEHLNMSRQTIEMVQRLYQSDIRSMINYIQSNQNVIGVGSDVIDIQVWNKFYDILQRQVPTSNIQQQAIAYIYETKSRYSIDEKTVVREFIGYLIREHDDVITSDVLDFAEIVINVDIPSTHYVQYCVHKLEKLLQNVY